MSTNITRFIASRSGDYAWNNGKNVRKIILKCVKIAPSQTYGSAHVYIFKFQP